MTADQLKFYHRSLLAEFDEVSAEIRRHSTLSDLEVDTAVVTSDERLLQKIELALRRIEQGSYGLCMACAGEISTARLDAKPSVSLCTQCQANKEQK